MNTVKGCDISHHNNIPASSGFHSLYDAGLRFVFLKATQGGSYTDETFHEYAQRIASMKNPDGSPQIYLGAYHFGDGSNPLHQADHFLDAIAPHPGVVPALDWETNPAGLTMGRDQAEGFVERIHAKTGKWPAIYFSRSWPAEHGIKVGYKGVLRNGPLWLAAYRSVMPAAPAPWTKNTFWQNSDSGKVAGMTGLDLDQFIGTEAELAAFWAAHSVKS